MRGLILHESGDTAGALRDLTQAIAAAPGNEQFYVNRGILFARMGRFGEAKNDFEAALSLNPGHDEARKWLVGLQGR